MQKQFSTINPKGTQSHFTTLAAAVKKARKNLPEILAERDLPAVWWENHYGWLEVQADGSLLVRRAGFHEADWRGQLERENLPSATFTDKDQD